MPEFGNLKDDNDRLNEHTKKLTEELADMIVVWMSDGYDARAIYAALTIFHNYYYFKGRDRLGADYMSRLDTQAFNLAQALLKKDKMSEVFGP